MLSDRFGVDLFVAILIIAVATVALSIFQWLIWSSSQIENNMFYFWLPVGIELAVAYALARGYLAHGQGHIITFGIAALYSGLLGVVGIWIDYAATSIGPLVAVTSMSDLLFSALNFFAAFQFRSPGSSSSSSRRPRLAIAYVASAVACVLVCYLALKGLGSIFYGPPGVGLHNLPNEAVSLLAIVLLFASSILLLTKGSSYAGASFVSWYAAGLVLTALLYLLTLLNLPYSTASNFLQGLMSVAAGACALIFAFVYLRKTSLNTASDRL